MRLKVGCLVAALLAFSTGCEQLGIGGPKPEPKTVGELQSEQLPDGRLRVHPRTEDVEDKGTYHFTVPHCGLDHMVDFDGSFWEPVEPSGGTEDLPFFYNSDDGTVTFEGSDNVVYEASSGERIDLKRLEGPIEIDLCA